MGAIKARPDFGDEFVSPRESGSPCPAPRAKCRFVGAGHTVLALIADSRESRSRGGAPKPAGPVGLVASTGIATLRASIVEDDEGPATRPARGACVRAPLGAPTSRPRVRSAARGVAGPRASGKGASGVTTGPIATFISATARRGGPTGVAVARLVGGRSTGGPTASSSGIAGPVSTPLTRARRPTARRGASIGAAAVGSADACEAVAVRASTSGPIVGASTPIARAPFITSRLSGPIARVVVRSAATPKVAARPASGSVIAATRGSVIAPSSRHPFHGVTSCPRLTSRALGRPVPGPGHRLTPRRARRSSMVMALR